jgi:hypothetical protein
VKTIKIIVHINLLNIDSIPTFMTAETATISGIGTRAKELEGVVIQQKK